ncbi:MAG: hypothetical protein JW967_01705 [Dehalococcoidales bacterium]|nr:hypothetical protein [Dehalococcoidales bacterium]
MSEITSVEEAIKKAVSFLNEYYAFKKLEKVKKVGDVWIVEYDVSILGPKEIVIIKIDSKNGQIIEYTKQ